MAYRNLLLTSTSLAFLLVSPGLAQPSDPLALAYENYLAAQETGDPTALASAEAAMQEECIIAGSPTLDACIGELEEAAAAAEAQFRMNLNVGLEKYQQALDLAAAGDFAAAQPLADGSAAEIRQLCEAEGYESIEACIGQSLPPLPQPPAEPAPEATPEPTPAPESTQAEEPTPAEQFAPSEEPAPSPEAAPSDEPAPAPDDVTDTDPGLEGEAGFEARINAALGRYQQAIDLAAAGDFAAAQPLADESAAAIRQLCEAEGYASIEACIGQGLPPLPQPPVEPTPEATLEPEQARAEEPAAAEEPAPSDEPAPAPDDVTDTDPALDGEAGFETRINAALGQYQQAIDLAAAGDFAAAQPLADESAAAIRQICEAEGFSSIEACIGQSLPPLPQPPAEPAPEATPDPEQTPSEEPTPAEEPASGDEPGPAPDDVTDTDPALEGEAGFEVRINAALGQYQQAIDLAAAGDFAAAQPLADESAAAIRQICDAEGYASIEACIGQSLPPLPQPPAEPAPEATPEPEQAPADEPAAAEEPAPGDEPAPAPGDVPDTDPGLEEAGFEVRINAALGQYQQAIDLAAAGDFAAAQPLADESAAAIRQICEAEGFSSIEACIGQSLPPLPQPPAEPAPEATPEPERAPAEEPTSAEEPARSEEAAPSTEAELLDETETADEPTQATEAPPADPLDQAEADINAAVAQYNAGAARLSRGDLAGEQDMESGLAALQQVCSLLGYSSNEECVADYGLSLAVPAQARRSPAAPVVGADQPVTETAREPLPAAVAPTEAAPLLDSQKQFEPAFSVIAPSEPVPTAQPQRVVPVAPPPASDAQAQAAIVPSEPVSVVAEPGEEIEPSAVVFAPPQNVNIINQTNVTNNSTVNNTTVNTTVDNSIDNSVDRSVNIGVEADIDQSINDNSVNLETNMNNITARSGIFGDVDVVAPSASAPAAAGFVFQLGSQVVISNPEQERRRIFDPQMDEIVYERLSGSRIRESIVRPSGVRIITIRDREGSVLRRSRISPEGEEAILVYGRLDVNVDVGMEQEELFFEGEFTATEEWEDPGADLPPLRLTMPAREYVLDADEADEVEIEVFLSLPPVEPVRRIYSMEEVKHSARIRDTVRRLEIGDLTFDTGKATISRSQVDLLREIANAMLDLLAKNPAETFLIEGHADAVGPEVLNLELSDRRAATVATILTEFYNVPPENLTTQGYGESFLKVRTEAAERLNRRVTVRRITPLITLAEQ